MVWDYLHGVMGECTRVSMWMIRNMGRAYLNGLMDESMLGTGWMGSRMGRVYSYLECRGSRESGRMGIGRDG